MRGEERGEESGRPYDPLAIRRAISSATISRSEGGNSQDASRGAAPPAGSCWDSGPAAPGRAHGTSSTGSSSAGGGGGRGAAQGQRGPRCSLGTNALVAAGLGGSHLPVPEPQTRGRRRRSGFEEYGNPRRVGAARTAGRARKGSAARGYGPHGGTGRQRGCTARDGRRRAAPRRVGSGRAVRAAVPAGSAIAPRRAAATRPSRPVGAARRGRPACQHLQLRRNGGRLRLLPEPTAGAGGGAEKRA